MDRPHIGDSDLLSSDRAYIQQSGATIFGRIPYGQPCGHGMAVVRSGHIIHTECTLWLSFALLPQSGGAWFSSSQVRLILYIILFALILTNFLLSRCAGSTIALACWACWIVYMAPIRYSVPQSPMRDTLWCWALCRRATLFPIRAWSEGRYFTRCYRDNSQFPRTHIHTLYTIYNIYIMLFFFVFTCISICVRILHCDNKQAERSRIEILYSVERYKNECIDVVVER